MLFYAKKKYNILALEDKMQKAWSNIPFFHLHLTGVMAVAMVSVRSSLQGDIGRRGVSDDFDKIVIIEF